MTSMEFALGKAFRKNTAILETLATNQERAKQKRIAARLESRILAEKELMLRRDAR